jgi:hypothetical protein
VTEDYKGFVSSGNGMVCPLVRIFRGVTTGCPRAPLPRLNIGSAQDDSEWAYPDLSTLFEFYARGDRLPVAQNLHLDNVSDFAPAEGIGEVV